MRVDKKSNVAQVNLYLKINFILIIVQEDLVFQNNIIGWHRGVLILKLDTRQNRLSEYYILSSSSQPQNIKEFRAKSSNNLILLDTTVFRYLQ